MELCGEYEELNELEGIETMECMDNTGRICYKIDENGENVLITSFIVDQMNHLSPKHIIEQGLDMFHSRGVKNCHIACNDNEDFHHILETKGFNRMDEGDNIFKNDDIFSSIIEDDISASSIRFDIPYRYTNELAQENEEREPFIDIYLSSSTSNEVFRHKLKDSGKLTFVIHTPNTIDIDTKFNIDCFAQLRNKHREFCTNQAGCVIIPLSELLEAKREKKKVMARFRVPASPKYEKGELELDMTSPESIMMENVILKPNRIRSNVNQYEGSKLVDAYKRSCWETFQATEPTWPAIKNIHAFEFVDRTGIYPAAIFHYFKVPASDESYWINAITVALNRDGKYTLDEFREGAGGVEYGANVMAQCCTLYSNYCKYITDKIDTNNRKRSARHDINKVVLIESFDNVRDRNAGDCEDFGKEEMVESFEMDDLNRMVSRVMHHNAKDIGSPESEDEAILRLYDARNKYYSFAALGGVSSATINGDYGKLSRMGAHEYLILIPKHYVYEMLVRTYGEGGHPLINPEDKHVGKDVAVMVCEGTGMLRPDGKGGEDYVQKRARAALETGTNAFDSIRKMFYYDRKRGSHFYQTITTLFTNEFFNRGERYGELTFMYKNEKKKNGLTYGVRFTDITTKSSKPQLFVQPEIPSKLFHYINEMKENQHPILPLEPPISSGSNKYEVKPIEKIYRLFSANNQAQPNNNNIKYTKVDYYVRFDQVNDDRIDDMLRRIKRLKANVEIDREPISGSSIGGYHVKILVPYKSF